MGAVYCKLHLLESEKFALTNAETMSAKAYPVPTLSVSTWSLHRALGHTYQDAPDKSRDDTPIATWGDGSVSLLDVPARVAEMGIHRLEICHFQVPSRERAYLQNLRAALESANVELLTLLVDNGDITHPDEVERARQIEWIGGWIDTAAQLGAKRVRVIAGKADYSPENLEISKAGLRTLAARAEAQGLRLVTENWYPLLDQPESVNALLDGLDGKVGLNGDFGNWDGQRKYDDLAQIFHRAESCHAKCGFTGPTETDKEDFGKCVGLARQAGFNGPYTLIYDSALNDNEWEGLVIERDLLLSLYA